VVYIYTVSGFVQDGRANGGGRHQVLGGSEWKGRCGGINGGQVIVYVPFVPIFFQFVEEASRRCSEPGRLPCSYYLDASVFLLPP
jgi:hypothetical protein